jgi:hypothetical protein
MVANAVPTAPIADEIFCPADNEVLPAMSLSELSFVFISFPSP